MSMITANAWVPRGYAAQFPTKHEFDQEEYDRISRLAQQQLDDAQDDLKEAEQANGSSAKDDGGVKLTNTNEEVDDDLKEYDLENYDNEPTHIQGTQGNEGNGSGIFGNVKSLVYYNKDEEDPYITIPENGEEDDDEEREELQILNTDNLVLAGRVEDDVAHLEVYVYEDSADNLYVHHDVMLPAIPLAVEWIDLPVGKEGVGSESRGNFVAVGTMDPDIEIWDLDVVDCMFPNAILGQGPDDAQANGARPKKKKKSKKPRDNYHVDSVLALAANRQHRNLLASASADRTVKLWDLNMAKCAKSYQYHSDKVCSLAWHPHESTAMLSGSYDKSVVAADMRAPEAGTRTWRVDSDIETVKWDPHDTNYFYASTESGILHYFDARQAPPKDSATTAVWRLQAHDESVSAFDVNPIIPGFLVTGSSDKQVKLWNVQSEGPSMVASRDLDVGRVFCANFAPDKEVGFRLAVAGSKGNLQIWDTSTNAAIRRAFATKVAPSRGEVEEKLVGLTIDESSSDSGEEDEAFEGTEGNGNAMSDVD